MSKALLIKTLRELRFLHDIAAGHLEHLSDIAELKDFDEEDILFREGDPADVVYLIVYGSVSVEICSPGIGCKRILTVGAGELLGWSALLEQSRLTATARAISLTRTVEINGGKLLTICERDPRFGFEIMRRMALALAKRLSATRMQLLDVYGSQVPPVAQQTGR
jgi:CRP-like cAMP-binding protein